MKNCCIDPFWSLHILDRVKGTTNLLEYFRHSEELNGNKGLHTVQYNMIAVSRQSFFLYWVYFSPLAIKKTNLFYSILLTHR